MKVQLGIEVSKQATFRHATLLRQLTYSETFQPVFTRQLECTLQYQLFGYFSFFHKYIFSTVVLFYNLKFTGQTNVYPLTQSRSQYIEQLNEYEFSKFEMGLNFTNWLLSIAHELIFYRDE
ncbi:hypothetical protein VHARVF571_600083 [Vibrio harveyi]|nr:hypothetical protein VHARVF571_600083 [Vibrio harveyi]